MHAYTHTQAHAYTFTPHAYAYACTHAHMHAHTHAQAHACTSTTHMHTCMHTYAHTCTHMCAHTQTWGRRHTRCVHMVWRGLCVCFKGHQKQVLNMRPVRKLPQVTERAGGFEGTGWPRGAPARPLDVRGRDRDQCRANGQNLLMGSQGLWDAPWGAWASGSVGDFSSEVPARGEPTPLHS